MKKIKIKKTKAKNFYKKYINPTYIKYFLSYLIIFTVLIIGFFFIIRNQITQRYFRQLSIQAEEQLHNIATQFSDDIIYISQVDKSITTNTSLLNARYQTEDYTQLQIYTELQKYVSSTKLINSIVYLSQQPNTLISTKHPIEYEDGIFYFLNEEGQSLAFDVSAYHRTPYGQLIYLANDSMEELLYLPSDIFSSRYLFFYTLDISDIRQQFSSTLSASTPAIALIDEHGQVAINVGEPQLASYLDDISLKDGIYEVDDSTSICVHTGILSGFSIVSLISNEELLHQIDAAFSNSYFTLLLLGVLGFLLVLLTMRITYVPLHRLTKKIVAEVDPRSSHLEQLDQAFLAAFEQNRFLQDKLEGYRLSIQKSLLDSMVFSDGTNDSVQVPNIDQFFDTESNHEFFILFIKAPNKSLSAPKLQQFFLTVLPGNDSCIVLRADQSQAAFLVNYVGQEQHKGEVLKELLVNLYEEKGYLGAVSNGSNSPLDIPALYENAQATCSYWSQQPVVDYNDIHFPVSTSLNYPHDKLDQLARNLKENDFAAANILVKQLFDSIGQIATIGSDPPEFFIRCVLVDMLVIIINAISQTGSKFKSYSDLFFETIYFCRSYSYQEKAPEIVSNTKQLLDLCQQAVAEQIVTPVQMRQLINACYCDPNFSIAFMADKFHVSIAYMSYLFKRELNINFSEYLWNLRLKKAKELLLTTQMSIDDISTAVGYLTPSSFRRKFKQETGLTPLQFRQEEKTED